MFYKSITLFLNLNSLGVWKFHSSILSKQYTTSLQQPETHWWELPCSVFTILHHSRDKLLLHTSFGRQARLISMYFYTFFVAPYCQKKDNNNTLLNNTAYASFSNNCLEQVNSATPAFDYTGNIHHIVFIFWVHEAKVMWQKHTKILYLKKDAAALNNIWLMWSQRSLYLLHTTVSSMWKLSTSCMHSQLTNTHHNGLQKTSSSLFPEG